MKTKPKIIIIIQADQILLKTIRTFLILLNLTENEDFLLSHGRILNPEEVFDANKEQLLILGMINREILATLEYVTELKTSFPLLKTASYTSLIDGVIPPFDLCIKKGKDSNWDEVVKGFLSNSEK